MPNSQPVSPELPPAVCPFSQQAAQGELGDIPSIHGPEFAADPRATYEKLRERGPIVPVEIDKGMYGYITTTYRAALHLLRHTPDLFAKDPHHWVALSSGQVPEDTPAVSMMQPRDNALWLDGMPHTRLRGSITDTVELVDSHALEGAVVRIADTLIDAVADQEEFDLVSAFSDPLPLQVIIEMFGCPPVLGTRMITAIGKLFDAGADAAAANAEIVACCLELIELRRARPSGDATSWLLAHPARLTDAEMVQQILLVAGAGSTPSSNLIANALLLMIDDPAFSGSVYEGVHSVAEAMDQVLWEDPPIANFSPLYARMPETYEGVRLEPGVPILVSFAAANSDPALARFRRAGNRAHLAFSAGVHACPAVDLARVITETAVERILDRLPDLSLAVDRADLVRRPGTFHSGWTALPVVNPPSDPSAPPHPGATTWTPSRPPHRAAPSASIPQPTTFMPKAPGSEQQDQPSR
ncbi:cytochrome P450 [Streptomyces fuscigenes]|uniref:cytochrome P450 n=1 Tax=Streptomyces fuscigenes TaxID=1528880 RepID=UPI001F15DE76|nr:cytochrome P450 [Streptomyces fuscigenes]MCF3962364.1 cytochrome P450 [Streptomyces fuscigenes]